MNQSQKGQLNSADWIKLENNFMIFFAPILTIYLGSLSALFSMPNHVFTFNDFVPNSLILGMMIKQVIDTSIDIVRKWQNGTPQ